MYDKHDSPVQGLDILDGRADADFAQASDTFRHLAEQLRVLVNVGRKEPGKVAALLGMDPDKLFPGVLEFDPLWNSHKWSLRSNRILQSSAADHARDMLSRDYLSSRSPEGSGPADRAEARGYKGIQVQEYISVLAPQSYVSPEKALVELFVRFFEAQAAEYSKGKDSIFDYGLRDIGIAYSSGTLTVEGNKTSVYLLVINTGTSEYHRVENSLRRMVHASRNDIESFLQYYEIDQEKAARAMNGFLLSKVNGGLFPVFFYASEEDTNLLNLALDKSAGPRQEFVELDRVELKKCFDQGYDPDEAAAEFMRELSFLENFE
ncbi:MAG: CAP domain-containing protein, partial [Desulfonatronovibrionaceae bacterium]